MCTTNPATKQFIDFIGNASEKNHQLGGFPDHTSSALMLLEHKLRAGGNESPRKNALEISGMYNYCLCTYKKSHDIRNKKAARSGGPDRLHHIVYLAGCPCSSVDLKQLRNRPKQNAQDFQEEESNKSILHRT
jgi:hypothetical protein